MPKHTANLIPCPPDDCRERRHMPAYAFLVYNAVIAMAKSDKKHVAGEPWQCFAYQKTIANHCNISIKAVQRAVKWLVANGWLRPMSQMGSTGANRYIVLEHADYIAKFPNSCPPLRYNPETGEDVGSSGDMSLALFVQRLRQLAGSLLRFDFESNDGGWNWRLRKSEGQSDTDAVLIEGQSGTDAVLSKRRRRGEQNGVDAAR